MKYLFRILSLASVLVLSTNGILTNYDQEWVTKVRLPLSMILKIFSQLQFDPKGEDTSDALYKSLLAFDTFQPFVAI